MNENSNVKRKKSNSTLAILSIVFGVIGLLSSCICLGFLPSMIGLILGIIALIKKDKKAIVGIVSSIMGLIIVGIIFTAFVIDLSKENKVRELIDSGEYDAAIELIEEYNFSENVEDDFYYEIYIGKKEYDAAFNIIFSDIEKNYEDIDNVLETDMEKLEGIFEFISEENQKKYEKFEIDREKLIIEKSEQAEREKSESEAAAKEKSEKEEKERQSEAAAKEKSEREASEQKKAEAEERERLEREAEAKKEQEKKDKEDLEKYGITFSEFVAVLATYSDFPDIESEEEMQEFLQQEYSLWKEDPKHWNWQKDSEGKWYYEQPLSIYEIESMAIYPSGKDLLRYKDTYQGQYIIMDVMVGSDYGQDEFIATSYSDIVTMIIKDERYYEDMRWLETDLIKIYGKFVGTENRIFTYKLTGQEVIEEVPIIEVYYSDLLQE